MLYSVLLIARVDTLGTIAPVKINIHLETADLLHNRNTFILCHTRIDCGFIYNNVPLTDDLANCGTCTNKRSQIRIIISINGSRNRDNIEVAILDVFQICRAFKPMIINGILQKFITNL